MKPTKALTGKGSRCHEQVDWHGMYMEPGSTPTEVRVKCWAKFKINRTLNVLSRSEVKSVITQPAGIDPDSPMFDHCPPVFYRRRSRCVMHERNWTIRVDWVFKAKVVLNRFGKCLTKRKVRQSIHICTSYG